MMMMFLNLSVGGFSDCCFLDVTDLERTVVI